MSDDEIKVVSIRGEYVPMQKAMQTEAAIAPVEGVLQSALDQADDIEEVAVVELRKDGSLQLASSHNTARVVYRLMQAVSWLTETRSEDR